MATSYLLEEMPERFDQPAKIPNPYPGLRPFESEHGIYFFGRDRQINDIVDRLKSNHLAAILGGSGCGKSSLILAGVLPELLAGGIGSAVSMWVPIVFRPEEAPIANLASEFALLLDESMKGAPTAKEIAGLLQQRDGAAELVRLFQAFGKTGGAAVQLRETANLLIVIDQFEEIFRPRNQGSSEVQSLVNLVLDVFANPHPNAYVIITMRSEDLHSCAGFLGLPEALNDSSYLVPRLRDRQLRDVIVLPAERYAFRMQRPLVFEEDVWAEIISETLPIKDDPDHLPLLQHLLFHLWRAALDLEGKQPGEVPSRIGMDALNRAVSPTPITPSEDRLPSRCLHNRADDVFQSLGADGKILAERMFTMMGVVDSNGVFKRNFVSREEVCKATGASAETVDQVIAAYTTNHAYIRAGRSGMLDVAHEAFIRKWDLFAEWVKQDHERAQHFGTLLKEYGDWQRGWEAKGASWLRRLRHGWRELLGRRDLYRLKRRSLQDFTVLDCQRWLDQISVERSRQPSAAAAGVSPKELRERLTRFVRLSLRKMYVINAAVALGVVGIVVFLALQWSAAVDRELYDRQIMLPIIESSMSESAGRLQEITPSDGMAERMARLAELSSAAKDFRARLTQPDAMASDMTRTAFLLGEAKAQESTFTSLVGALSQYLWEVAPPEQIPPVPQFHPTTCSVSAGRLLEASDGAKLLIQDDQSVLVMTTGADNRCEPVQSLQAFPPDSTLAVDPELRVLVVRSPLIVTPSTLGFGAQWSVFLLRRDILRAEEQKPFVIRRMGAPAVSWMEEIGGKATFGRKWFVTHQLTKDHEFELGIWDSREKGEGHKLVFRHLNDEILRNPDPSNDAEWSGMEPSEWTIFRDLELGKPYCSIPFAHDAKNYCFSVSRAAATDDDPNKNVFRVELFVKVDEAVPELQAVRVASLTYEGDEPSELASGKGRSQGWFRIRTKDKKEYKGVWTPDPLEQVADRLVREWASDGVECIRWNGLRKHGEAPRYKRLLVVREIAEQRNAGIPLWGDLFGRQFLTRSESFSGEPQGCGPRGNAASAAVN